MKQRVITADQLFGEYPEEKGGLIPHQHCWAKLTEPRRKTEFRVLTERVGFLEEEVVSLKALVKCHIEADIPLSKTEQIYLKHKTHLEKMYFDSVVAFDPDTEKIAEIANSMSDLLEKLYKVHPYTKKFYFKRVGSKILQKLR